MILVVIIKYVHFEPFKYNVIELKKDIHKQLDEKQDNVIMFVYDDKKIFEKSKAYSVQI